MKLIKHLQVKRIKIKHCITACAALALLTSASSALAAYPDSPIRIVAPFPSGNSTDAVARLVARKLEVALKQPVIVDNRPGAGGVIGTQAAANAKPDGYTLLMGSVSTLAINPGLYSNLPYQTLRDFIPIAQVAVVPLFLAVTNSFPAQGATEFVRAAKRKPGSISYGSSGNGTSTHIMMEAFNHAQGIRLLHVPYKGSGPALTDLMGGRIDAVFDSGTTLLPLAKEGKLRLLAVASKKRHPAAPDVPTIAESGRGNFDAPAWVGLAAPKGTPREVIYKLNLALRETWLEPDVQTMLNSLGAQAVVTTPAEFSAYIAEELVKWDLMIKQSGAKVD